jgi:hypothetical protein
MAGTPTDEQEAWGTIATWVKTANIPSVDMTVNDARGK